jgi:hypothetical protein
MVTGRLTPVKQYLPKGKLPAKSAQTEESSSPGRYGKDEAGYS